MKYRFVSIIIFIFFMIFSYGNAPGVTHPHIIVKETEYQDLSSRSEKWPWSVMKVKAINDAKTLNYNPGASYTSKCSRIHNIAGACALAYILDSENRSIYVQKAETQLSSAINYIRTVKGDKTDHEYNVDPAHAAFMMYIMLDIMYNDLSADKRQAMENDCDFIADNHNHSWCSSEYSIKGMKELYHNGKTPAFEAFKNKYRDYVLSFTSDDGIYTTGPGYANSRLYMDGRMQKKIFMDICEYQQYHEFYSNPRFQNLYEWFFGYSVTPFNRSYTFGDSPPTKTQDHWAVSALCADRFSVKAQQYASWRLGALTDDKIKGQLLHYILCDSVPRPALRPVSRIFRNGGAWLLEDSDSPGAIAGALWNMKTDEGSHNHFDVNAVHIAAYGEHVLRNSGYDGWGAPGPEMWDWIHKNAESSNTVTVDGHNHSTWRGGGITEGFVGGDLEYASGSSGSALPISLHQRNLIFVKPQKDINNGYFIVSDEVKSVFSWANNSQVNVAWHPNSGVQPTIVKDQQQYRWKIGGCNYSGHQVYLTIFQATVPDTTEIRTGYLGSYSDCSRFSGKYLYSNYNLNKNDRANLVTLIYPTDDTHLLPVIERLTTVNSQGAKIEHNETTVDFILGTLDTTVAHFDDVMFKGQLLFFRRQGYGVSAYFVRKGTFFYREPPDMTGFQSNDEISIFLNGDKGQIISPGTEVIFYYQGIRKVLVDDVEVPNLEQFPPDYVKVYVDSGKHKIQFSRQPAAIEDKSVNPANTHQLYQNYPNPFNSGTKISYKLNVKSHVQLDIYSISGQKVCTLYDGEQEAGDYACEWDGRDDTGTLLSSGIYIYQLTGDHFIDSKKLLQIK